MIKSKKQTKSAGVRGTKPAKVDIRPKPQYAVVGDALVVTGASVPPGGVPVLMYRRSIGAFGRLDEDGALRFALPAVPFGGTLDIVEATSGKSLGLAPIALPGVDLVEWQGWQCVDGKVSGRFGLSLPDSAGWTLPDVLPVEGRHESETLVQAFAWLGHDGLYTFQAGVKRVLRMNETLTLLPAIAGEVVQQPLVLTAETIGTIGNLDANPDAVAGGWAIDVNDRSRRIEVDIRVNGESVGIQTANAYRDDLRQLDLSDGYSGFRLSLPHTNLYQDSVVQAFIAGTDTELNGSPYHVAALSPVVGSFDAMNGTLVSGWALNREDPDTPVEVEAVCGGEVVGRCVANNFRPDVLAAGMPTGRCGFMFTLERPVHLLLDHDIEVRPVGQTKALEGSPRTVNKDNVVVRFMMRSNSIRPETLERLCRRLTYETRDTLISIVMPIYNTRSEWLLEALNSVLNQWSANWELICVDDASPLPHVTAILSAATRHDRRIKLIRSPKNVGIAKATNLGIAAARGDYVAFMDHDDVIEPDAIHKLAKAAQTSGAELIYSDEAVTGSDVSGILEVRARPSFSHDYYLSHPYFVHMVCVRRSLAETLGGWDETLEISGDVDFVLRAIENANAVAHVPHVLYRWRTHDTSTGHAKKHLVTKTMMKILSGHLHRLGLPATAHEGTGYNQHRIDWPDDGGEVLIVIPTKNRVDLLQTCVESIERTSEGANIRIVIIDHASDDPDTVVYLKRIAARHTVMPYEGVFNYALMNNLAVKAHGGEAKYVIFCNNDVEAIQTGWIQRMRSLAARQDVGAVGPLLLYGNKSVQHAGVLVGFCGAAEHVAKFQSAYNDRGDRNPGYNCILSSVRDYSAVTAACMMVRRDLLTALGGFDERFVVGFNDTDLCLRIKEAGFRVLYDAQTVLFHHESATRSRSNELKHPEDDNLLRTRWANYFQKGDPFYSPLLNDMGADHVMSQSTTCATAPGVRAVSRGMGLVGGTRTLPAAPPVRRRRKAAAKA